MGPQKMQKRGDMQKKHEVLKDSTPHKEQTITQEDQGNYEPELEQAKSRERQSDSVRAYKFDVEQMIGRTGAEKPKVRQEDDQTRDQCKTIRPTGKTKGGEKLKIANKTS